MVFSSCFFSLFSVHGQLLLLLLLLLLLSLLLLLFRWRHAAVVVAVYLLMEQCGGRRGDYESCGRLAGMTEDNALG